MSDEDNKYDAHRLAMRTYHSEVADGLPIYASKDARSLLKAGDEAWFVTDKGPKENFWGKVLNFGWDGDNDIAFVAKLRDKKPVLSINRRAAIAHSRKLEEASDD